MSGRETCRWLCGKLNPEVVKILNKQESKIRAGAEFFFQRPCSRDSTSHKAGAFRFSNASTSTRPNCHLHNHPLSIKLSMAVCSFDGNSDMLGLGIRIGFYLQWYSGIFASWLAPTEVPGTRFSNAIFIAATFLALLILTIRDQSSLQVVEAYIILFILYWDPSRYPLVRPGPVYSILNVVLLTSVASFQLWFWFARVPQLTTQNCQEFGSFFAKIQLNQRAFRALNIVFYFLLLLSCVVVLSITASVKMGLVERTESPPLRYIILNNSDSSST